MKTLFAFCIMLLVFPSVFAQDNLNRLAFAGAGYFDGAQAKGTAGFIKQLGENSNVYNITDITLGTAPANGGNIRLGNKDLQMDVSSGFLHVFGSYKGVTVFGLAKVGLQQSGDASSAMFDTGGGVHRRVYKTLGLAAFGKWKYAEDPVDRTMRWQINPMFAITFPF
jgi:hypothetical protein